MNDKKSFILYAEWETLVSKLSDEDAGKLFRAIFAYNATREEQDLPAAADMLFSIMRMCFDKDIDKWESTRRSRAAAGSEGGKARAESIRKQTVANEANTTVAKDDEANQAVNVNVNVNGYVGAEGSTEVRGTGEGKPSQPSPNSHPNKTQPKKFTKPTLDEVIDYCELRKNRVDPERFYNHYERVGWMVGKNKMKDWRAAVRYWEKSDAPVSSAGKPPDPAGVHFALENKRQPSGGEYFDDIFMGE